VLGLNLKFVWGAGGEVRETSLYLASYSLGLTYPITLVGKATSII